MLKIMPKLVVIHLDMNPTKMTLISIVIVNLPLILKMIQQTLIQLHLKMN